MRDLEGPVPEGAVWSFVLLKHPSDYPIHYVVRGWVRHPSYGDAPRPTDYVVLYPDYESAHRALSLSPDLTCRPRLEGEDPVIVETWV
jgi:hypothetical protein